MRSKGLRIAVGILAVCFAVLTSAQAQNKFKAKGLITARTGENIVLKILDDDTKVQQPKGLIGIQKQTQ